jgi:hypothetical protein
METATMTPENFKLVKTIQNAADFGLQWFNNGSSRQAIYTLYFDKKPIKTYISACANKKLYALIEIGNKAINGVEVVPKVEIIYQVKFSVNPKKKTLSTKKIVVTDEN